MDALAYASCISAGGVLPEQNTAPHRRPRCPCSRLRRSGEAGWLLFSYTAPPHHVADIATDHPKFTCIRNGIRRLEGSLNAVAGASFLNT